MKKNDLKRQSYYLVAMMHRNELRPLYYDMLREMTGRAGDDFGLPPRLANALRNKWKASLRMLLLYYAAPDQCNFLSFNDVVEELGTSRATLGIIQQAFYYLGILQRAEAPKHYFIDDKQIRCIDKFLLKIERQFSSFNLNQLAKKRSFGSN